MSGVLLVGVKSDAVCLEKRRLRRKASRLLVLGSQIAGGDLGGLHVRLIERVDLDDRTRHGGCELPEEELTAELEAVADRYPRDGMARPGDRVHGAVLSGVRLRCKPHVDEEAVPSVGVRWRERLTIDGYHS